MIVFAGASWALSIPRLVLSRRISFDCEFLMFLIVVLDVPVKVSQL